VTASPEGSGEPRRPEGSGEPRRPEGSGEPRRPEGSGEPQGGAPVGRAPAASAPVELAVPEEPAELRDRVRALAEQDPAAAGDLLGRGEWIAGPLWRSWGPALRRAGLDQEWLRRLAVGDRRELWLWVAGERTWTQCAGGLLGRVRRRLPDASA
jgi:hypothetical protein